MNNPNLNYSHTPVASARHNEILSPAAIRFVIQLQQQFNSTRKALLKRRETRQTEINEGNFPGFLPETSFIRNAPWTISPVPETIADRRVEITGPVERKMIINALNSGARVFMADFEDSCSPTWVNLLDGQVNLIDAVNRTIEYTAENGRKYTLNSNPAVLFVRPRGWHLEESNFILNGIPVSASLFDFGLFFFHNAQALSAQNLGPFFYLPKIENHLEAKLWNEVFVFAQDYMGIPQGSIKATVLIETILASFEMDEILYELRNHSAGLNCGRWDYIFSVIKKFIRFPEFVLPDRSEITMTVPFMKAYTELLVHTCHKRGAHAMGGMAAQIPVKNNPELNAIAIEKVRQDKLREVKNGFDGSWVAHPGLVNPVLEIFNTFMPQPNQIHNIPEHHTTVPALLSLPAGNITREGFENNVDVCLQYLESWLKGNGCVPIYNLMEDAATAEICRAQLWQWLHHGNLKLASGEAITFTMFNSVLREKVSDLIKKSGKESSAEEAAMLLQQLTYSKNFEEFLTSYSYTYLQN